MWETTQSADADELREAFEMSRTRILGILDHAILLTQIEVEAEKFACERVSLAAILNAAVEQVAEFAGCQQVTVEPAPTATPFILGAHDLLVTALGALLETAVKFSEPGGVVHCACDSSPDEVQIAIRTAGRTIPVPAIAKFFDLFAVAEHETLAGHLGLGPPAAHRILALFGGSVTIENRQPPGIQITVSLRRSPE
jgi:two-component system sensor histidine kinase BaeS